MSRLGEAFRAHHRQLLQQLERHAEGVFAGVEGELEELVRFLETDLLPHARSEEQHLYPAVAPLLRRHGDPTATMRVDHECIEEHVRAIRDAAAQARRGSFAGLETLRRRLLSLLALFRVHLEKEERVYLPLVEAHLSEAQQDALLDAMHEQPSAPADQTRSRVVDVRRLPPPQRHPLIFQTFQALGPGEAFELVNDHDPKPLYYQFAAELPGQFTWQYLEQGPEVWRVRIGKPAGT
ncbi:MAG: DUF2249 domain-containing protein [Armatimonadota bacterium]|nr:DUF2249 domain-containing protein [Armatimonadota bacterium]MDR7440510.1 DUF2249 domain-containing protein [Armatimonadota bacterium]MDR7563799.1 DUF2249 domain-containing protein [Armatimonadota bacterium]MDR7568773.1 DUF2249 domain-containing protein [Armatimonadota bacterium]MDR7602588.1 DUF2249 domain-containing protein [Armatimonadota bacterium]